jgi:two-component sensor histidine kinase
LATSFALVIHEFATNAAKYGALSTPTGRVDIAFGETNNVFSLTWTERGGPRIEGEPSSQGFGTKLAQATVVDRLGGELSREWNLDGLTIRLSVARPRLAGC